MTDPRSLLAEARTLLDDVKSAEPWEALDVQTRLANWSRNHLPALCAALEQALAQVEKLKSGNVKAVVEELPVIPWEDD